MKKLLILTIAAAAVLLMPTFASAQATATGTLTVSATVTSSIQLVFNSDAAGVALGGSGTSAATLAFGSVSAFGAAPAGVTITPGANSFTVSSPVDVKVTAANSASANYTLAAVLNTVDNTNTWTISGSGNLNTPQTLTGTGAYGANTPETVTISIPFSDPSGTSISNTIKFTATAN
jgi:hypothetical protein